MAQQKKTIQLTLGGRQLLAVFADDTLVFMFN